MSATTVKSNVEQVDINLDEIFNAAPSGADMIQDDKAQPKNSCSGLTKKADMSFADPDATDVDDISAKVEEKEETTEEVEVAEAKTEVKEDAGDILDSLDNGEEPETKEKETRGRKSISGISDVFSKLIQEEKIVPCDDDKA